MLATVMLPTISCQLRSENVHQEAIGPGFDSLHLQGRSRIIVNVVGGETTPKDLTS
jgi:hypothetical protein